MYTTLSDLLKSNKWNCCDNPVRALSHQELFKCLHCKNTFYKAIDIWSHIGVRGQHRILCKQCYEIFHGLSSLILHIKKCYRDIIQYEECGENFEITSIEEPKIYCFNCHQLYKYVSHKRKTVSYPDKPCKYLKSFPNS